MLGRLSKYRTLVTLAAVSLLLFTTGTSVLIDYCGESDRAFGCACGMSCCGNIAADDPGGASITRSSCCTVSPANPVGNDDPPQATGVSDVTKSYGAFVVVDAILRDVTALTPNAAASFNSPPPRPVPDISIFTSSLLI